MMLVVGASGTLAFTHALEICMFICEVLCCRRLQGSTENCGEHEVAFTGVSRPQKAH